MAKHETKTTCETCVRKLRKKRATRTHMAKKSRRANR